MVRESSRSITEQHGAGGVQPPDAEGGLSSKVAGDRVVGNVIWPDSSTEILRRLNDVATPAEDRDVAVLAAETVAFGDDERSGLLDGLGRYISDHRFAQNEERGTVVGSAVRKYAMNMDEPRFESYAEWMQPTATEYLYHRVELELVKGATWRLSLVPLDSRTEFPNLTRQLREIATCYTNPRLILQMNYAATALNAIVAVCILEARAGEVDVADQLWRTVAASRMDWFADLLADRMKETIGFIAEHDTSLAGGLERLVVDLSSRCDRND